MKTLTSLVCLAVSICLTLAAVSSDAQMMKIGTGSNGPKPPKTPKDDKLAISCQTQGTSVQEFLVATAYGGEGRYTISATPSEGVSSSKDFLFATLPNSEAGKNITFTVTVTDKNGKGTKIQKDCPVAIASTVPPAPIPGGLQVLCHGIAYVDTAFQIADVTGGAGPYIFTDSSLQKPLILDPPTGLVTGASTQGVLLNQQITVVDKNGAPGVSASCDITVLPQRGGSLNCALLPVGFQECVGSGVARNANINTFWQTNGSFVFFNQVKSIFNQASNSATVSADIGTLNFPIGMQLNIGTNIQAGSTPTTPVSTGSVPTLSPAGAAQAAQNMLYGGTIFASAAYPILAVGGNRINSPGGWGGMLDVSALEGVDVQSFTAGTSASATSPSTHTNLQLEGYLQMNSTNLPTLGGGTFAGALFAGGSYGYSYTSQAYIRDYGIKNSSNRLGVVSGGILLNGIAKLAFSKAFGPSQTYYDGTVTQTPTMATTVNNFKVWSFQLAYQSPAPASK